MVGTHPLQHALHRSARRRIVLASPGIDSSEASTHTQPGRVENELLSKTFKERHFKVVRPHRAVCAAARKPLRAQNALAQLHLGRERVKVLAQFGDVATAPV